MKLSQGVKRPQGLGHGRSLNWSALKTCIADNLTCDRFCLRQISSGCKMQRRQFLIGLTGTGIGWPLSARAQQPAVPMIGYVGSGSPDADTQVLAPFRKGLSEMGYVEGRNLAIEY